MSITTLDELYTTELQDIVAAERAILDALPAMAEAAASKTLRDELTAHLAETRTHLTRLERLLEGRRAPAESPPCEAVVGIIQEMRRRISGVAPGAILDAVLTGTAQRIEHYELAAYRCARTYARALSDADAEYVLQQTLDEEAAADHRLAHIADESMTPPAGRPTPDVAVGGAQPPLSLMPGVWMTETSGFAAVPPRADVNVTCSETAGQPTNDRPSGQGVESELMMSRGGPDGRAEAAQPPGNEEPRIERYEER